MPKKTMIIFFFLVSCCLAVSADAAIGPQRWGEPSIFDGVNLPLAACTLTNFAKKSRAQKALSPRTSLLHPNPLPHLPCPFQENLKKFFVLEILETFPPGLLAKPACPRAALKLLCPLPIRLVCVILRVGVLLLILERNFSRFLAIRRLRTLIKEIKYE